MRKAVVQFAMQLDHINAQRAQHLRRKCACRAIAASNHGFQPTLNLIASGQVVLIGLRHALDALVSAAVAGNAFIFQHHIAQSRHFIRAESQRPRRAHFNAGPAIFIMARGHHSNSRCVEMKLREISRRR